MSFSSHSPHADYVFPSLPLPKEHFRQVGESQGRGFNISATLSSNIDDKTMHELYAWPFADAVRAGVGSVMCSYNQINNSYGCQNSKMMNGILKAEMNFPGFVMSDWQAQHAGAAAAAAGLDMAMPGDTEFNTGLSFWGSNLTVAVINGTVPEWRIDDMVLRIMAAFYKVEMEVGQQLDTNFNSWTRGSYGFADAAVSENWGRVNYQVDVREDHALHIRESAAKGTVLLKNLGSLPLVKPKFVAVVGDDAGPNSRGPNGCPDRGCIDGTLAMIWGSGTAEFPYLVTPDSALQRQAVEDGSRYESILSNYRWDETRRLVGQPNVTALVFVYAASGEGFIDVEGNVGDRNNLTLWRNGDDLIKFVSSICPNTIVVIHSVGPVLVTDWYQHPNITAILWAGQPGQESGNSITDVLYGKVSPGKSPFTWGPTRESYGTDILYEPNNGNGAPQQTFSEGNFIDYRHFDRVAPADGDANAGSPIYEFGFGLTWSSFEYSNLEIQDHKVPPYKPTTGNTAAAPILGNFSTDLNQYAYPSDIRRLSQWIYPYLSTTSSAKEASGDPDYGQTADEFMPAGAIDGSPQRKLPASGGLGGNPGLWEVLYTVTASITNKGNRVADEIPQLYVSLGGDEPKLVLRGFDRLEGIKPGETVEFSAPLRRRDISNWDVVKQDWVETKYPKSVCVGSSSRKLPLCCQL